MKKGFWQELRKGSYYFNASNGEMLHLDDNGVRPDGPKNKLIKIPTILIIIAGPALGMAYVIFLPLSGILAMLAYLGVKAKGMAGTLRLILRKSSEQT